MNVDCLDGVFYADGHGLVTHFGCIDTRLDSLGYKRAL